MPYKMTGRDITTTVLAVYEKFSHIADQFPSISNFPVAALDAWRKAGILDRNVTPAMFVYFNRNGRKVEYNEFIFIRLKTAIEKGGSCIEDIIETALSAPILKPDEYAARVACRNMQEYLDAMGGEAMLQHHDKILNMVLAYHRHEMYAFVQDEEKKRAAGVPIHKREIDTWQGLSSEFYHRIRSDFDWDAVASFIVDDTTLQGKGLEIQQKHGAEQLVYKAILPSACDICTRLYLNDDGTNKIFKIGTLLQNGPTTIADRISEDAAPKYPTCGPSHLYCSCQVYQYTGYELWAKKN